MQQLASLLAALPQKALAGATSLVKTMQTARMMSTLARMSDKQLEQIGISRSDIPRYAVGLIEAA